MILWRCRKNNAVAQVSILYMMFPVSICHVAVASRIGLRMFIDRSFAMLIRMELSVQFTRRPSRLPIGSAHRVHCNLTSITTLITIPNSSGPPLGTSRTFSFPDSSGPPLGTSRTFSFPDSRDLLEVLRRTSSAERAPREDPLGSGRIP